jgi:hypothetical protein
MREFLKDGNQQKQEEEGGGNEYDGSTSYSCMKIEQ